KNERWKYLEQPIMNFYTRAVYAACIRASDDNYPPITDKDLHQMHYDIDLVPYGKIVQDNITRSMFCPFFFELIPNFDSFILCEGCGSFPKRFPEQGLCKLCGFYWNHGLTNYIVNTKFHSTKEKLPIQSLLNMIEAVLLEGGGKTLIFSVASVLFCGLTVVFTPLKSLMGCQLKELIDIGIPSAYLFAATDQPPDIQEKIFQKLLQDILKFCGLHQKTWNQLIKLKDEFTSATILMLTATCSEFMANQLIINLKCPNLNIIRSKHIHRPELNLQITSGQIIIYCAMPDECIDIITALKGQYNLDSITTYHGKLSSNEQKKALTGWKTALYRYIVATNAFGMGVDIADIRVIIHTTFPISITNLVQEIGRAAQDDDDFAATIFESSYCFQDIYTCQQILYYTSFKWTIDLPISECNVCDNCIRRSQDKAVRVNVYNDLLRMLNVTEKLLRMVTERKLMSFGRE
ncbi:12214_t:CDS:2, partial [Gigaspora rosea]